MELKKREITQAVRKKKEDEKEKEKETKLRKRVGMNETGKTTHPVKPQIKGLDTHIQQSKIQKTREDKIKPINLLSVRLSLKDLDMRANANSDNKRCIQTVTVLLSPTKLTVKDFNTECSVSANGKSSTVKVPKLSSIQLKPISQNKQRVKEIKIDAVENVGEKIKLKPKPPSLTVVAGEEESKAEEEIIDIDFIEILFGKVGSKILSGKPLCIIVERHRERYEYIVAAICREIYREKKGRRPPQPIPVKTVKDSDLEFKADISDQIILVEKAEYSETLKKILSKLPFSDLGYLILVTDDYELESKIRKNAPTAEEYLIKVEPTWIEDERKIKMVELIGGSKVLRHNFGVDFIKAIDKFENNLQKYLEYDKVPDELKVVWHRLMAKSLENPKQASEEHSAMKSFVWQYLWRKYGKIPKLEDERGVDVSINYENYEIETFYGCEDPRAKLTEKMEKFSPGEKVFFVLRNITILMHLKDLVSFRRTWRKRKVNVEVFGISFDNEKLIPIDEFIKEAIKWKKQRKLEMP